MPPSVQTSSGRSLSSGGEQTGGAGRGAAREADEQLFARVAGGDGEALAQLYERYSHALYDFAARITRDRVVAADVVQTVFATTWERVRRGPRVTSPRAWLYRVTRNAAIDELRRRGPTAAGPGGDAFDFAQLEDVRLREPSRVLIDEELAELVWSTAAALSADDYALLDLYVRRELSHDELAAELGIRPGALYTRLSRLRRSFADALTVKLLVGRGGSDCEALHALVEELGDEAETAAGRRLLRDHIRSCRACEDARSRYVTAEAILASLAPVPLTPGAAEAIWSRLAELLGLGAAAGGAAAVAATCGEGAPAAGGSGSGAGGIGSGAVVLAALALLVAGALAAGRFVVFAPSPHHADARDPVSFRSARQAAGGATSRNRITIWWTRQPAAAAYSVLWSHGPRDEPDAAADLPGSATRVTSAPLAPGRWWFHLRTEGRDGSWTDTVHLGPFVVAAAPAPARRPAEAAAPAPARPPAQAPPVAPEGREADAPPAEALGGAARPQSSAPFAPPALDATPPSGQRVEPSAGPWLRALAVPLALDPGVDLESGVDPVRVVVERQSALLEQGACRGWGAWSAVALGGSTDTTVADGRCYRYRLRVADRAGNVSAFSRPSNDVAVDATPPSPPALTLTAAGSDSLAAGTTVFYRSAGAGRLSVAAASADEGSGLASIAFPALAGAAPTAATAAPFAAAYAWRAGELTPGPRVVTAYDRAGNAATASFALVADDAGPVGAAVSVAGGPLLATGPVPLLVQAGADAASGVDPASPAVERDSAPLAGGACGAFAEAWTAVTLVDGADAGVADGACYRYRAVVADRVGNRSVSAPSGEARLDETPPSAPLLTLSTSSPAVFVSGRTVFFRSAAAGTLSVAASSDDGGSGLAAVEFPALAGAAPAAATAPPFAAAYSWSAGAVAPGTRVVTAYDHARNAASAAFALVADDVGPVGAAVAVSGGPSLAAGSVPLLVEAGVDAGSGLDSGSLTVERDSAPLLAGGCGAFAGSWAAVTPTAGADPGVEVGRCYRYRVVVADRVGNRSVSAASGEARVAAAPSAPLLTLATSSPAVLVSGTTVFFAAGSAGSLSVSAAVDGSTASVAFPALAGASGGGVDATAPFAADYGWTALTATGVQSVTAANAAGATASSAFALATDDAGPTGMSVSVSGGPDFAAGPVPLLVEAGVDAGSGVDSGSLTVERDSAPLVAGACGAFAGSWSAVTLTAGADAGVAVGSCYRYRVVVADRVGNRSVSAASGEARVAAPPSAPVLALATSSPGVSISGTTVLVTPGTAGAFSVFAAVDGSTVSVAFPALTGAVGGGLDTAAPFAADYSWAAGAPTATGAQSVTTANAAGATASSTFTLVAAPLIELAGSGSAYQNAVQLKLVIGSGLDPASPLVERQSAPVAGGACPPFTGVWAATTPVNQGGGQTFVDKDVLSGTCYRYRVTAADMSGTTITSAPTGTARVG